MRILQIPVHEAAALGSKYLPSAEYRRHYTRVDWNISSRLIFARLLTIKTSVLCHLRLIYGIAALDSRMRGYIYYLL